MGPGGLAAATFRIADWGHAQIVDEQTTDDITPLHLSPPEVILGGEWDQSVDTWTYGCLVFRALTNTRLFEVQGQQEEITKTNEESILDQMICLCGGSFHVDFLRRCRRVFDFCSLQGNLINFNIMTPYRCRIVSAPVIIFSQRLRSSKLRRL
ncbi:hypothetical protein E4T56_gene2371 [Termitomyces sp. T112]|nr:hypothetical protein E4T56_gene2371 [Termitomyces sp. T112]